MISLGLAACDGQILLTASNDDSVAWEVLERPLGRGHVLARNSLREAGAFVLRLEPDAANGGQFRTVERFGWGHYEVSMRCPRAEGSLCAFFLYEDRPGNVSDEIDIEIFNDGSRRALLVTWVGGARTNLREILLPFDPAAATHVYRIDRRGHGVGFSIDGIEYARFMSRVPTEPMHVYMNAWYPTWLEPGGATAPVMWVDEVRLVR